MHCAETAVDSEGLECGEGVLCDDGEADDAEDVNAAAAAAAALVLGGGGGCGSGDNASGSTASDEGVDPIADAVSASLKFSLCRTENWRLNC